jgi:mannosyltransferase OCH1-like enzyme
MKYIRTKDEIYEVVGADSCSYLNAPPEMYYITSYNKNILKSKVIAQADTIEELCDIYVSVYEEQLDNEFFEAYKYTPMEVKNFYTGYIPKEVYGAIWTDKGLIYVAKMNEKGYLELV